MYRKQKINAISLLFTDGLLPMYRLIKNRQEFSEKEERGQATQFINSIPYLSKDEKIKLCTYYEISSIVIVNGFEIHRLVTDSDIPEYEFYMNSRNRGIIDVRIALIQMFEDESPNTIFEEDVVGNRLMLMELINTNINLIDENIENLSYFLENEVNDEQDLEKAFEEKSLYHMSKGILRSIDPNPNWGIIKIKNKYLKEAIYNHLLSYLAMDLKYEYGDEKAERVFNDLQKRLDYVLSKVKDNSSINSLATFVLIIDKIPLSHFEIDKIFFPLWQMAYMYKDNFCLYDSDTAVLIRIYEFLIENQNLIEKSDYFKYGKEEDFIRFFDGIYDSTAQLYGSLWEKETAIKYYKKAALISIKYEEKYAERYFSRISELLGNIGSNIELLDFCIDFFTEPQKILETRNKVTIDTDFDEKITLMIGMLLLETDMPFSRFVQYKRKLQEAGKNTLLKAIEDLN